MNKVFSAAVLSLAVAGTGLFFSSGCRKKKDTIAKIYVRDSSGNAVQDCQVILKGESTITPSPPVTIYDTMFTNSAGEAVFNFNDVYQLGQAGVAVLNIEARKGNDTGEGIIKVEQETTSEETVYIQP